MAGFSTYIWALMHTYWHDRITQAKDNQFDSLVLDLYHYQRVNNTVYANYLDILNKNTPISELHEIPFMPISFFKSKEIKSGEWEATMFFESSGTSGSIPSKHFLRSPDWYYKNTRYCFEDSFGRISQYIFAGLLPSYLERPNSSLVAMVRHFSELVNPGSNTYFYLRDFDQLFAFLTNCQQKKIKLVLFGLSIALYDFASAFNLEYPELIIIETGGMKTDTRTLLKEDILQTIGKSFPRSIIASEYGMTELLSQAYAVKNVWYKPNVRIKFFISEINDPFTICKQGERGQINIIDLANVDSCAFIQTEDCGLLNEQGQLNVLGRLDQAELRGCTVMM